jgi:hypothetical protein
MAGKRVDLLPAYADSIRGETAEIDWCPPRVHVEFCITAGDDVTSTSCRGAWIARSGAA